MSMAVARAVAGAGTHAVLIALCMLVMRSPRHHVLASGRSPPIDLTDVCHDSYNLSLFMTSGMGMTDSVEVIVAAVKMQLDCAISVSADSGVYLILVVEFLDQLSATGLCEQPSTSITIHTHTAAVNVCKMFLEEEDSPLGVYLVTQRSPARIDVYTAIPFATMRFLITSSRFSLPQERCSQKTEYRCTFRNSNDGLTDLCVTRDVVCDGNSNCPMADDEDPRICSDSSPRHQWLVVSAAIVMVALCLFVCVRLLCTCVPRMSDRFFIFSEDEDNKMNLKAVFVPPARVLMTHDSDLPALSHTAQYGSADS